MLRHTRTFPSPNFLLSYPRTCHWSYVWNHQCGQWKYGQSLWLITTTPGSKYWLEYVLTGHLGLTHRSEKLHIFCPGSVTFIDFYSITTLKHIKPFLSKSHGWTLKSEESDDTEEYSTARANLQKALGKLNILTNITLRSTSTTTVHWRRMHVKGIQSITDDKSTPQALPASSTFLPDELNHFYAFIEQGSRQHMPLSSTVGGIVTTCLKTTKIIAVPKHYPTSCLNDLCWFWITSLLTNHLHWIPTSLPTIRTVQQRMLFPLLFRMMFIDFTFAVIHLSTLT